jgi:hypothetical protein
VKWSSGQLIFCSSNTQCIRSICLKRPRTDRWIFFLRTAPLQQPRNCKQKDELHPTVWIQTPNFLFIDSMIWILEREYSIFIFFASGSEGESSSKSWSHFKLSSIASLISSISSLFVRQSVRPPWFYFSSIIVPIVAGFSNLYTDLWVATQVLHESRDELFSLWWDAKLGTQSITGGESGPPQSNLCSHR